jgi:hypothetical protein
MPTTSRDVPSSIAHHPSLQWLRVSYYGLYVHLKKFMEWY